MPRYRTKIASWIMRVNHLLADTYANSFQFLSILKSSEIKALRFNIKQFQTSPVLFFVSSVAPSSPLSGVQRMTAARLRFR